jgi:ATP-dependent exoDNAse (exonuclease V) beta subunit
VETEEKSLKIYNASAGSGKTYHLVKEYVKLLVAEVHSKLFSNIIAMTFTNKAALEMKERIIKALDEISSPVLFSNNAAVLSEGIAYDLKLPKAEIEKRCGLVLANILHQYEDFHVMTIDKFNLRLIRSFSRDLDLSNDFEVVMDEVEVIEKIVDDLLNQLGAENNSNLNRLLIKYAESKVDEGESWNFRRKLVEFGKVLRIERNATKVKHLMEMDFSIERFGSVIAQRKAIDAKFKVLAQDLLQSINDSQLNQEYLPGKSGTMNGILKIAHATSISLDENFISKTLIKSLDAPLTKNQIFPEEAKVKIRAVLDYYHAHLQEYAVISLYLQNFFNMALLQYMAKALDDIKKEEQIILISEFNSLISNLIQNENAPFIYERLGTKFKHFLLDEFQDTSHLQWLNLVPLVHESLGYAHKNLIVGDPKQSIYRFKNGVAEQFVELPRIYNPEHIPEIAEKSNLFNQMGETLTLDDNWRSSPTIVNFNNSFFEELKSRLSTNSISFYNSIQQNPKSTINGKIVIQSKETKKVDFDLLPKIIEWIEECKADGFSLGDICLLGGTNKDCNNWALGLTEAGYKVVSADSLLIDSNIKVQLAIAYLNWRFKPSDENRKKQFAELFFRQRMDSFDDYKIFIEEKTSKKGKNYRLFNEKSFIETYFKNYTTFFFKYESIYDLVQGFYRIMQFNELENSYLHHLADVVYDFELKKGPHLAGFLEEYARKKGNIAVQIPLSDDAVQVMTIHKAKGLEFPVVILPSLNFTLDVKSEFLVEIEDFIVYKKPTKNEILEPLREIYQLEYDQVVTDRVNLTYVAMTRPVERLYILNEFEKSRFGAIFHETLKELAIGAENENELLIEINSGKKVVSVSESDRSHLFHPQHLTETLWFPDIALQDNEELMHASYLSSEMQFGLQFHLLISRIEKKEDIQSFVNAAIQEGEVDIKNATELIAKLTELFDSTDYTSLFINKIDVINEQAILVDSTTTLRPDKIILKESETLIIDYKTGIPNQKDQKQVNTYKQVLEEMGYPKVSCYLFYSSINELRLVS